MKLLNIRLKPHHQQGLTLIELMIGIAIGAIVIAGVIQMFVSTLVGSRDLLDQARLENELNNVLLWMSDDIRRAGYWGDEALLVDWGEGERNPFTEGIHRITASEKTGEAANSCITYAYNLDNDSDPTTPTSEGARIGVCSSAGCKVSDYSAPFNDDTVYDAGNVELFGYQLSGGTVRMRTGTKETDTAFDCDGGHWEAMTDENVVTISSLTFNVVPAAIATVTAEDELGTTSTTLTVESIQVGISITGRLTNDASVTKTLSTTVKLGNNLVRE
jgi:prepilin peptidase dependent protein B